LLESGRRPLLGRGRRLLGRVRPRPRTSRPLRTTTPSAADLPPRVDRCRIRWFGRRLQPAPRVEPHSAGERRRVWAFNPAGNRAGRHRLAAIVLAGLGLTDATQSARARWRVAGAAGVTAVVLVVFVVAASSVNRGVVLSGRLRLYHAP